MSGSTDAGYRAPEGTGIGHVHFKVSDLERSLAFYTGVLGFNLVSRLRDSAAFLAAGDYHHHIALNTWHSRGGNPPAERDTGLYHAAIRYPSRRDLAAAVRRVLEAGHPLAGAADHGVSIAVYLSDPDGIGLELYWDRPREEWPRGPDGRLELRMADPVDLEALLREATAYPS